MTTFTRKVLPWQLIERFTRYRQFLALLFGLCIFFIALIVCWNLLKEIKLDDLKQAMHSLSIDEVLYAGLAAVGSYIMLICYEWSAARYAGVKLKPSILVLGAICASAIGNAIGLSALSGGAVRCRLYFKQGLTAIDVARMSLFVTLSLGCTLPLLAAIAALLHVNDTMLALHMSATTIWLLAGFVFCIYTIPFLFLYYHQLPTKPNKDTRLFQLFRWAIRLPSLRLASSQFVITLFDAILAGAILYFLLPTQPNFVTLIMVYIIALVAGGIIVKYWRRIANGGFSYLSCYLYFDSTYYCWHFITD